MYFTIISITESLNIQKYIQQNARPIKIHLAYSALQTPSAVASLYKHTKSLCLHGSPNRTCCQFSYLTSKNILNYVAYRTKTKTNLNLQQTNTQKKRLNHSYRMAVIWTVFAYLLWVCPHKHNKSENKYCNREVTYKINGISVII